MERSNQDRVEIIQGTDGDWYPRYVSANNETVFTSEGHRNMSDAKEISVSVFPGRPVFVEKGKDDWEQVA